MAMIETLNHYQSEMKYSVQPQTLLEISIMKISGGHRGAESSSSVSIDGGSWRAFASR